MRLIPPDCLKFHKLIILIFFTFAIKTLVSKSPYKFILVQPNKINLDYFGTGRNQFIKDMCTYDNCYVTDDKYMFGGELNNFHAILFDGSQVGLKFPRKRYYHQKYVYVNLESSANHPICHTFYNRRFHWTFTYKLDSDFPFTYLRVRNANGTLISPKKNMKWTSITSDENSAAVTTYVKRNKTKAAAWFVSKCRRVGALYVRELKVALKTMGLVLDIYGDCGKLKCPKSESDRCDAMLANDYYFYLAFENSLAEDYVTEKVYRALANAMVPIVYGGANYTRFLPPGSYIDARSYIPSQLAHLLNYLIDTPEEYRQYFRWKRHYSVCYGDNSMPTNRTEDYCGGDEVSTLCQLCKALNNPEKFGNSSLHDDVRAWWTPNFKTKCSEKSED